MGSNSNVWGPLGAGRARGSWPYGPSLCAPRGSTGKLSKAGAVHPAVYHPLEGPSVGRRGVKEFRAAEALALIAADRDHKVLVCPTCASATIERNPKRGDLSSGRITLTCKAVAAARSTWRAVPRLLRRSPGR